MGLLSSIFGSPQRPQPTTVIKDVLGNVMLEVPVRNFAGSSCLRGKDLSHVDLRGHSFYGANLENVNLFGADLRNCSFTYCNLKDANLAYALIDGADFRRADLDGADLLHTRVRLQQLDEAIITPTSAIPGIKVVAA
jgi:uncharacterized protein YjbI with pentapeptide repeats